MSNIEDVKAILERLKSRTATESDRRALKAATESGVIRVSSGSRGVAIGGNAERATIITGDGNIVLNVGRSDAEFLYQALNDSRGPKSKQRIISPALPYLCNRTQQENELHNALEEHREGGQQKPLICIIHGDETECTDAFVQRLSEIYLPELLSSHIEFHLLPWPKPKNDHADAIAGSLDQLAISAKRIFEDIKDRTAPVVIATHISTDWYDPHGRDLIPAYLNFWSTPQNLKHCPLLINYLCVTYVRGEWWNLLRRRNLRRLNNEIKSLLDREKLKANENIRKVVLTKLPPIDQDEAAGWARLEKVRAVWNDDVELLISHIKRLYHKRLVSSQRPMPMLVLAPKLKRILLAQTE